jgi:hypothetical protein
LRGLLSESIDEDEKYFYFITQIREPIPQDKELTEKNQIIQISKDLKFDI